MRDRQQYFIRLFYALVIILAYSLAACVSRKDTPTSPTASRSIPTPTEIPAGLPDLALISIALQDAGPFAAACEPAAWPQQILLRIGNRGAAPAGAFLVQVNETSQSVQAGLAAGGSLSLSFWIENDQVVVNIDAGFQISESDESNNRLAQVIPLPTLPATCLPTLPPPIPTLLPQVSMPGHTAAVLSIAFSPDGGLVASGSVDNTLRLWRVAEGTLLRTMRGHPFPVTTLDFSPNGMMLATGSTDSLVRIWRISDGSLLRTLEGHAGWISSLDISPDGRYLVSSAQDFTVRIWRMSDGRLIETIDEGMAQVNAVAFAPDSRSIAWTEANGAVRLRSIAGEWLHTLESTSAAALSLAFSPDGAWLVVGYADGTMRVWQTADGAQLQTLKSHVQKITGLAFSPDAQWLVSASQDNTLRLWSIQYNEDHHAAGIQNIPVWILNGHSAGVNSAAFSPSGAILASASDDGSICLWQVPLP